MSYCQCEVTRYCTRHKNIALVCRIQSLRSSTGLCSIFDSNNNGGRSQNTLRLLRKLLENVVSYLLLDLFVYFYREGAQLSVVPSSPCCIYLFSVCVYFSVNVQGFVHIFEVALNHAF